MGDHKVPGRSKGEDYKEIQKQKTRHQGFIPSGLRAGVTIKTQDGQVYEYDEHGAARRVAK